jgi:hypothetical protein
MALENLISIKFTQEELDTIDTALTSIEGVMKGKAVNLTPEERRQYGSIAEQNKLVVNKAKEYMEQRAEWIPNVLDKDEFDRDYTARQQIETRFQRAVRIAEMLSDTKVLLDHDNYFAALTFYRYIKFLAGENEPGSTVVYNDMKQFFTKNRKNTENTVND